jgi:hypothetical protein
METRVFHLPLQHLDLVPEHQEFDVLRENNVESPSGRGERMLQVP